MQVSKTRVKRKAATPQQKQPIIINTHVINKPAAQQYDQQQQLQQANQQKQQNYEELLNVPPVERNKLYPEKVKQKEYFENELISKLNMEEFNLWVEASKYNLQIISICIIFPLKF